MEIRKLSESAQKWLQAMKEESQGNRIDSQKGEKASTRVGQQDSVAASLKGITETNALEDQKRAEKISRLSRQIASGTYKSDIEAVVNRMLEETL